MKRILVFFLLLISVNIEAQTNYKNEIGIGLGSYSIQRNIQFEAMNTNYLLIKPSTSNFKRNSFFFFSSDNIVNKSCTPEFYYERKFGKRFSLKLSYQYFQMFTTLKDPILDIMDGPAIFSSSEFINFHHTEFGLNYNCFKYKKFEFYFGIYTQNNFVTYNGYSHVEGGGWSGDYYNKNISNKFNYHEFSVGMLLGARFNISNRWNMKFETSGVVGDITCFSPINRLSFNYCF